MQRVSRVLILLTLVASVGASVPGGTASARIDVSRPGGRLSSGELREALADISRRPRHAVADRPELARVEVFHRVDAARARRIVERAGGTVTGEVPGSLVQAEVRWEALDRLERAAGVTFVRPQRRIRVVPRRGDPMDDDRATKRRRNRDRRQRGGIGEEVAKTNAAAWHAAGHVGTGVKVGIIDLFSNRAYRKAQRAGEVPPAAGTVCFSFGRACDVFRVTPRAKHGTAVAEVVHEMAPQAQLVLGFADTTADLQAVVDGFAAQGVQIITRSLAAPYDGPGDGTGPIGDIVNDAIAKGMTWFNSAGNAAGTGSFPRSGSYYRGTFTDEDGDGLHEFSPRNEALGIPCFAFTLGLRWDDFSEPTADVTDFDLIEVDQRLRRLSISADLQGSSGGTALPLENFGATACSNRRGSGLVYVVIKMVAAGSGADDVLEFQNNGLPMTVSSNPHSAAVPVCDSANPGQVCVGAIDPPLGTVIASYSSQGPTNDDRLKPDVSAAACVTSFSFKRCFNGTSASAPAAAGAAALVLGAGLGGGTPADLGDAVRASVVDRGAPGPDDVYGTGELVLPAPPL